MVFMVVIVFSNEFLQVSFRFHDVSMVFMVFMMFVMVFGGWWLMRFFWWDFSPWNTWGYTVIWYNWYMMVGWQPRWGMFFKSNLHSSLYNEHEAWLIRWSMLIHFKLNGSKVQSASAWTKLALLVDGTQVHCIGWRKSWCSPSNIGVSSKLFPSYNDRR